MALTVSAGDLFTVRLIFNTEGDETAYNVLHYQLGALVGTPPGVVVAMTEMLPTVYTEWKLAWAPISSEEVTFQDCTMTSVFPLPRSLTVHYASDPPATGGVESESLPLQDCVTLLKQTEIGNKTGLGRMFVCGIPESQADQGRVSAGYMTGLGLMKTALLDPIEVSGTGWAATLQPVLLHGPEDNPTRISRLVSTRFSDNIIKVQRRRRPGKGV